MSLGNYLLRPLDCLGYVGICTAACRDLHRSRCAPTVSKQRCLSRGQKIKLFRSVAKARARGRAALLGGRTAERRVKVVDHWPEIAQGADVNADAQADEELNHALFYSKQFFR